MLKLVVPAVVRSLRDGDDFSYVYDDVFFFGAWTAFCDAPAQEYTDPSGIMTKVLARNKVARSTDWFYCLLFGCMI